MREILGKAKTIRELLKGVKYSIDYYQREYKWQDKQIRELVDDLTGKFLEEYDPAHDRSKVVDYPHYYVGSIIISKKDSASYIVDGQQRLTSLSLLLILLRQLQLDRNDQVNIDELIVSERYGQKSFNLHVDERTPCMEALFHGHVFDLTDRTESVQNLYRRYQDLDQSFPDDLRGAALPYFIDWLLENVHLVEITAYSDDDAYTIFVEIIKYVKFLRDASLKPKINRGLIDHWFRFPEVSPNWLNSVWPLITKGPIAEVFRLLMRKIAASFRYQRGSLNAGRVILTIWSGMYPHQCEHLKLSIQR